MGVAGVLWSSGPSEQSFGLLSDTNTTLALRYPSTPRHHNRGFITSNNLSHHARLASRNLCQQNYPCRFPALHASFIGISPRLKFPSSSNPRASPSPLPFLSFLTPVLHLHLHLPTARHLARAAVVDRRLQFSLFASHSYAAFSVAVCSLLVDEPRT
jgi:hypothetical protein